MVDTAAAPRSRKRPPPSRQERAIGAAVLIGLALIAAAVFARQFRLNPAVENLRTIASGPEKPSGPSAGEAAAPIAALPDGLAVLSPIERFDRETLSDKIDGKAELYLAAGFVGLESQRLARRERPEEWIEAFVYDMGTGENAFAVFSAQRRPGVEPIDLAPNAYRAENALFFTAGSRYIELIGSVDAAPLMEQATALARALLAAYPAEPAAVDDRRLFPAEGLVAESIRLIPQDAFGLAGFDRVYAAVYRLGPTEATAFLSRRESAQAAQALQAAYAGMLKGVGAAVEPVERPVAGALAAEVVDFQEIVFRQGAFIAGVREAADREQAVALAARLSRSLKEAGIEP